MASKEQDYKGTVISSASASYVIQGVLGRGSFGKVFECRNSATNTIVAIKVLMKKGNPEQAKREVVILEYLKKYKSEDIICLNNSFTFSGHYCFEFERLDMSLLQFLGMRQNKSLMLQQICPILCQLASALELLERTGIVHTDLHPDNIMIVNHLQEPLKVKVIDFGQALHKSAAQTGAILQSLHYRSPEILLGAPFNEAIDVWSLGCVAATMILGATLFPGTNEYDMIKRIWYIVGKLPDQLIEAGRYAPHFFRAMQTTPGVIKWQFSSTLWDPEVSPNILHSNLRMVLCELSGHMDARDLDGFIDLVEQMLKPDPAERIKPSQILQHPFITMSPLVDKFSKLSIKSCAEEESPRIRPLENKGHPSGQSNKENKENIEQSSLKKCKRILEYADCSDKSMTGCCDDTSEPIKKKTRPMEKPGLTVMLPNINGGLNNSQAANNMSRKPLEKRKRILEDADSSDKSMTGCCDDTSEPIKKKARPMEKPGLTVMLPTNNSGLNKCQPANNRSIKPSKKRKMILEDADSRTHAKEEKRAGAKAKLRM